MATVRAHISDDSRSASFAGLDCYQVDPQSQLLGIRFRPSAGLDAGEVKMIHGLDYLATGLPAPSINTWHRLRVFVDSGTAEGAGEIDGVGVYKTAPISLSSHYVPFVSRYADADLYIEPTGYNVISFDDYSVEAVARGTLRGRVDLEGWLGTVSGLPLAVEVRNGSGSTVETLSTTLGADGSYQVVTGYRGSGFIVAKASHWLAKSTPLIPITKFGVFEVDFQLLNGDINGDNSIDIADYAVLSAAYGRNLGELGYVASADLNGDEAVDIGDYSILSSNYGLSGD
ncbi:MAG: hypothetical protein K1X67_20030 [Fimbriimonadaceae bacterium]|nr:hypothetical protein [Fimbriimonadaceae bacterium]